jgi:hypothetical protein
VKRERDEGKKAVYQVYTVRFSPFFLSASRFETSPIPM